MLRSPGCHSCTAVRAAEVTRVLRQPLLLARSLAGLAALRLAAELVVPGVRGIRGEPLPAVRALEHGLGHRLPSRSCLCSVVKAGSENMAWIAGGEKAGIRGILEITKQSIEVGGAGVAYGRNVFQAEDPSKVVKALSLIVNRNYDVDEAYREAKL